MAGWGEELSSEEEMESYWLKSQKTLREIDETWSRQE